MLAPPQADPAGGEALWGNLAGLMRPPLARQLHGQPWIGWEYTWTPAGMTIIAWVPGTVPPGMAERAIEAAWPGTHTITAPATAPLPAGGLATGGRCGWPGPRSLPLKTGQGTDPLRALAAAGTGLTGGEHAIVQVLARPATGSRLRRARSAIRRLRDGRPARLSWRLLDGSQPRRHRQGGRAAVGNPDPLRGHHHRRAGRGPGAPHRRRSACPPAAARPGAGPGVGHRAVRRADLAGPPPAPPRRPDRRPPVPAG